MARLGFAKRPRVGTAMIFFLIGFFVLAGIVSFAVDFGTVMLVRAELRSAVDAACLAGATGLPISPAEARKRAKEIAQGNKANGKALVMQDSDIELGTWNGKTFTKLTGTAESTANSIRITVRLDKSRGNAVNLLFAPLLGRDTVEMKTAAVASFSSGADVVVVQDVSASFSDELTDAKTGVKALLDSLNASGGKAGFGLVAHSGTGKTISAMKNVKNNYTPLSNSVNSLKLCGQTGMPKCSGTDPAAGLEEGIKVFNDPAWTTKSTGGKAMILVSDGEPTQNSAGAHPKLTATQLLTLAQQIADTAWSQNIHVYVVFFNRDNNAAAAAKVATLIRGKGDFVQVTDAKKLPQALEDITKKLPMQLVN